MNKLADNFPKAYKPRGDQNKILKEIDEAIADGYKFIIIQSPTGTGKSMFAAAAATSSEDPSKAYTQLVDDQKIFEKDQNAEYKYSSEVLRKDAFGTNVLTITKALQNQYNKLFDESVVMKGKSNYVCDVNDEFDADLAPCMLSSNLFKECKDNKTCTYLNKRNKVLKSKFGVLNYSMFLSLPEHVKKRSFLVCDEASELEDELVSFFSVDIEYDRLKFLQLNRLTSEDSRAALAWLTDVSIKLDDYIRGVMTGLQNKGYKKPPSIGEMARLKALKNLFEKITHVIANWYSCEYVIELSGEKVTFVPLYVNTLSEHVFKHAEVIILMSATIIDPTTFAKTLGIDKYHYLEVDSVFDPIKSPVYCPGKYPLNWKNIDKNLPKVVEQAKTICEHYKDKNGIVHTHSFKITQAMKAKVGNDTRYLFREGGISNENILDEHDIRKDATVLVSPSLSHGTDLIGDSGEFQVIMKMPFLPLGSKRVKMLFEKDKDWYAMKMLVNLMQMCGRCTRSADDSSETFILDGQAFDILKRNWSLLPRYFKDRLK